MTLRKEKAMICLAPMGNRIEVSKISIQTKYSSSSLETEDLMKYLPKPLAKQLEGEVAVIL